MVMRAAPAQYTSAARSMSESFIPYMSERFIAVGSRPVSITW